MVNLVAAAIALVAGWLTMVVAGAVMDLLKPLVDMAANAVASGLSASLSFVIALILTYYLFSVVL